MEVWKIKTTIALEWLSGCEGCEVALLDSFDILLDKIQEGKVEIVYAPILLDYVDYDRADIMIITGSVRTEDDERRLRKARERSKYLYAFGSCACFGGIHGLADQEGVSKDVRCEHKVRLRESVDPIWQIAKVDLAVPGCPPPDKNVRQLLKSLLEPLATTQGKTVCDECLRKRSEEKKVSNFRRGLNEVDKKRCFLEQGVPCIGFATLSGCGALCPSVNYPCYGCMGFDESMERQDRGIARAISALASALEVEKVEDALNDPIGFFMRFSYPCFSLKEVKKDGSKG